MAETVEKGGFVQPTARRLAVVAVMILTVAATMFISVTPAITKPMPPDNDDFPWWCPDFLWPCPLFFGGGGSQDCSQGTDCEKQQCQCERTRHDGEEACRSLPPIPPGAVDVCLAGVLIDFEQCIEIARVNCEGT